MVSHIPRVLLVASALTCLPLAAQKAADLLPKVHAAYDEARAARDRKDQAGAEAALRTALAALQKITDGKGNAAVAEGYLKVGLLASAVTDGDFWRPLLESGLDLMGDKGDDSDLLRPMLQDARRVLPYASSPLRAVALFERWFAVERAHSAASTEVLQRTREEYATCLNVAGRSLEAVDRQREILQEQRQTLDAKDPRLDFPIRQLASFLHDAGYQRKPETRLLREEALKILTDAIADPGRKEEHEALRLRRCDAMIDLVRSLLAERRLQEAWDLLARTRSELAALPDQDREATEFEWHDLSAVLMRFNGDLQGAQTEQERLLDKARNSKLFGPAHVRTLGILNNLTEVMIFRGQYKEAAALLEKPIQEMGKVLTADAGDLLIARQNLASALVGMKEKQHLERARKLLEEVIAAFQRTKQDLRMVPAQGDMALCLLGLEKYQDAKVQFEVVDNYLATKHVDLTNLLYYRRGYAQCLARLELKPDLGNLFRKMLQTADQELEVAFLLSPHETFEVASQVHRNLAQALSLAAETDKPEELRIYLVSKLETVRAIAIQATAAEASIAGDTELAKVREDVLAARERLAGLVNNGPLKDEPLAKFQARVAQAVADRETAEKALRQRASSLMRRPPEIKLASVAKTLPKGAAAVLYHRLPQADGTERLFAYLMTGAQPDQCCQEIALGDADAIDKLVSQWRASLGKPVDRGRPAGDKASDDQLTNRLGFDLQQRVLGEVFKKLGKPGDTPTRIHICADSSLHLVPLDCLPMDAKADKLVGDSYRIILRPHLGAPNPAPVAATGLLAMGNISYGKDPTPLPEAVRATRSPISQPTRQGTLTDWGPLPETRNEVQAIVESYNQLPCDDVQAILGPDASKARFLRDAKGCRYLHLATHGFFERQVFFGNGDPDPRQLAVQKQIEGLAPMTLCGLVFAGANNSVHELLTAEEVAAWDLGGTLLAVLSACDTNNGLRASGQGISSVQTALHCAGVRMTITALWKVDDEAAKKLMTNFYSRIWESKAPEIDAALWEARKKMMKDGNIKRPADWMAFVLSSDSW